MSQLAITFKEHKALKDYDSVSLSALIRTHFMELFPIVWVDRVADAIQVASYLHRHDVRRGARGASVNPPYIEHPLRVAIRLYKYFGSANPVLIIAAILHDTVEDHAHDFDAFEGVSIKKSDSEAVARMKALEFISRNFGYQVAQLVEYVSNPPAPEGQTKAEKLAAYHEHIVKIAQISVEAILLKFSDFVDNAGSLHHHYEYGDKKVMYFVERYSPLIAIYEEVFSVPSELYDHKAVLVRLEKVKDEFQKFRDAA